jgi:hypothetical protein
MTIVYPRLLPSSRLAVCNLELERSGDVTVAENSGRNISVTRTDPLWTLRVETQCASEEQYGLWRAWLDSLRGPQRLFFGRDAFRPYPLRYAHGFSGLERAGGGAFDGTATSWSVNAARDEVELAGLPASLRLIYGDYIGFAWGSGGSSKRSLHRVLEDSNADIDGNGVWTVEPAAPRWLSVATATIARPDCLMRLRHQPPERARDRKDRRIAFEALQHLEP